MLGWPKRYKLAHAVLWECSYKRLKFPKLAQLLDQLGVFLTWFAAQLLRARLAAAACSFSPGCSCLRTRRPSVSESSALVEL